jgi:predicted RNase H-like nuclease
MANQLPYTPIAGVVPCPGGWLVQPGRLLGVTIAPDEPHVLATLAEVIDYRPTYAVIVLGVPVGIVDAPNGGYRDCDLAAREMLGWPRRVDIPRVPSREALYAPSFEEAKRAEPWLTPLAYRRFRWLREVDKEIKPYHQRRIYSASPELSFYVVHGDTPTNSSPFWHDGPHERLELIRERLPGLKALAHSVPPSGAALRHVVDAAGLLWTARRIAGKAITRLPAHPQWDSDGRRIELVR